MSQGLLDCVQLSTQCREHRSAAILATQMIIHACDLRKMDMQPGFGLYPRNRLHDPDEGQVAQKWPY